MVSFAITVFFAYEAQHFVNKSLLDNSKSVVISGCLLKPRISWATKQN